MSHALLILKIYTTFKDVKMILKIFFDIYTGFRFSKISVECSVHSCSCPWIILTKTVTLKRLKNNKKNSIKKFVKTCDENVPRFFQKTFMAMPASIAFILWNQRAGMNNRSPNSRTSLDMDETLDFWLLQLRGDLIILQTLNQSL